MKNWTQIWGVSLLLLGVTAIILGGSRALGLDLPDAVTRALGITDLILLPVFSFACVKRWQAGKDL